MFDALSSRIIDCDDQRDYTAVKSRGLKERNTIKHRGSTTNIYVFWCRLVADARLDEGHLFSAFDNTGLGNAKGQ
jgi:hypothetical protein